MFEESSQDMQSNDSRIQFHPERETIFSDEFEKSYKYILNQFMIKDYEKEGTLDHHKIAALIVICGIKSKFVSMNPVPEDTVFLGNESIALSVALSFMQSILNDKLQAARVNKRIEKYAFPKAWICRTQYYDIMVRNLYYAQEHWELNPLELAEKFFLIEYITLEKNGIDPNILCESSPEQRT
ncbi:MAG: hypothetical protein HDQ95_05225 [Roseburia sp.]|nr:hypothetical protein [Roseburia sp.]